MEAMRVDRERLEVRSPKEGIEEGTRGVVPLPEISRGTSFRAGRRERT